MIFCFAKSTNSNAEVLSTTIEQFKARKPFPIIERNIDQEGSGRILFYFEESTDEVLVVEFRYAKDGVLRLFKQSVEKAKNIISDEEVKKLISELKSQTK